jgi:hypothetical protein
VLFRSDGHLYSKLPPGNQLFAFPLFALGEIIHPGLGNMLAMLLNPILGAICVLLLFQYLLRRYNLKVSLFTSLFVGVASNWWYESRGFGSEVGGGLFLLVCFIAAMDRRPAWSAWAFAMAILFRPINLLGFPLWLLNFRDADSSSFTGIHPASSIRLRLEDLFRTRRGIEKWKTINRLLILTWPVFGIAAILCLYNFFRFEAPFYFGYKGEAFSTNPLVGVWYLLFSPGRSLFLYSPAFLFAIPGAWLCLRQQKSVAYAWIATVILYVGAIGGWHSWDGGWSWGSRLLTPIFPIFAIMSAPAIETLAKRKWAWPFFLFAGGLGFGIGLLALLQDPLLTMQNQVATGNIPYADTLFSIRHSLIVLQWDAIQAWLPARTDSLLLRVLAIFWK